MPVTLEKSFVVGSNWPGCLPEDVDAVCDFDTAKEMLVETIERAYDDVDVEPDFRRYLQERIDEVRAAHSYPIEVMIESRVYFVQGQEH
jgi:hypothetical protein